MKSKFYNSNFKPLLLFLGLLFVFGLVVLFIIDFPSKLWASKSSKPNKQQTTHPDSLIPFRPGLKTIEDPYTKFEHITTEDGLTSNNVTRLFQDKLGYIWIGTSDGLNRYDGYNILAYTHSDEDTTTLPGNAITGLAEDPTGTLWVCTRGGLCSYNRQSGNFQKSKNPNLCNAYIEAIYASPDSTLWLLKDGILLVKYNPYTLAYKEFPFNGGTYESYFNNAITPYSQTEMLVGGNSKSKTFLFDLNTQQIKATGWKPFMRNNQLKEGVKDYDHGDLTCYLADKQGNEYIHSAHNYSYFRTEHTAAWQQMPTKNGIYTMIQGVDGTLWCGGFQGGLTKYELSKNQITNFITNPNNAASISDNSIYSLMQDQSGNIFIGTGFGVNILRNKPNRIKHIRKIADKAQSIASNKINCLYADTGNQLWIGYNENGFDKLNTQTNEAKNYLLHQNEGLANPNKTKRVFSIRKTTTNNLLIGYWSGIGLSVFDPKTEKAKLITLGPKYDAAQSELWILDMATLPNNPKPWVVCWSGDIGELDVSKGCFTGRALGVFNGYNNQGWFGDKVFYGFGENFYIGWDIADFGLEKYRHVNQNTTNWAYELKKNNPNVLNSHTYSGSKRWYTTLDGSFNNKTVWLLGEELLVRITDTTVSKFYLENTDKFSAFAIHSPATEIAITGRKGLHLFNIETEKTKLYANPNIFQDYGKSILFVDKQHYWICGEKGIAALTLNNVNTKISALGIKGAETLKHLQYLQRLPTGEVLTWSPNKIWLIDPNKNTFMEVPVNLGQSDIRINHVCERQSNLYISTNNGLITYHLKTRTRKQYQANPASQYAINSDIVFNVAISPKGQIAVNTEKGICLFDEAKGHFLRNPFRERFGLTKYNITCLTPENDSVMWVGTENGLNRNNIIDGSFRFWNHETWNPTSLSSDKVFGILLTKNKTVWVATEKGLDKLNPDGKTFTHYTLPKGKFNECHSNITQDHKDNLWLATNEGLLHFEPLTGRFTYYNSNSGLQKAEFRTITTLPDGQIAAAGWDGLNIFHPDSLQTSNFLPKAMVFNFKVNDSLRFAIYSEADKLELPHNQNTISFEIASTDQSGPAETQYAYKIEGYDKDWIYTSSDKRAIRYTNLPDGNYRIRIKLSNADGIWNEQAFDAELTITPPFWKRWWFLLLCIGAAVAIIRAVIVYRERQLKHENLLLENKVNHRTEQLNKSKQLVEEQNKHILQNITHAQKIQQAILPPDKVVKEWLQSSFVLYLPKDIVSGDFYFMDSRNNNVYFAAVDCTGHGVSGAFVSIIGHTGLKRTIDEFKLSQPSEMLQKLNELVVETLKQQSGSESLADGMDIALCRLNILKNELLFSGGKRPLWLIRKGELIEFDGNKSSIGGMKYEEDKNKKFEQHKIQLESGDVFYVFTDGFADQFSASGKKLKAKNFKAFLMDIHSLEMLEQRNKLNSFIDEWRGHEEQTDDICVIGVKV